jgi:hypothetical protein
MREVLLHRDASAGFVSSPPNSQIASFNKELYRNSQIIRRLKAAQPKTPPKFASTIQPKRSPSPGPAEVEQRN